MALNRMLLKHFNNHQIPFLYDEPYNDVIQIRNNLWTKTPALGSQTKMPGDLNGPGALF
jgi:hypothetical protein